MIRQLNQPVGLILTPAAKGALTLLLGGYDLATALDYDKWQFALEFQALKEAKVEHSDVRVLISQGLAEHRVENTWKGAKRRRFDKARNMRLETESCFTLSDLGVSVARALCSERENETNGTSLFPSVTCDNAPFWDTERRELRMGSLLVKRFRRPAQNQETILAAFQEDGWPPRIDDPLPGTANSDSKDRLHNAVKKLNRQTNRVLLFSSDGKGMGVLWMPRQKKVPRSA